MINGHFVTPVDGTKGFDCNTVVSPAAARLMYNAGYRYAVRYVRRKPVNPQDITEREANNILEAGLGLMLVQHVANEGWVATGTKGAEYGLTAAQEAHKAGYPAGGIVWCDLEGVAQGVPAQDVINFCNNWYSVVAAEGYDPGVYVGFSPGITASQMYYKLRFKRYWGAYNLNADLVPLVRGIQFKQTAFPGHNAVPGVSWEFDDDKTRKDKLGDRVKLLCSSKDPDFSDVSAGSSVGLWGTIRNRFHL